MKETKLFKIVTGTEMKPWLSRNMLPNINTCENGWSNFSANLRVVSLVSLKLLELTQFAWPNQSIYFNFSCAVPRDDVIESTRFLMRPPVVLLFLYRRSSRLNNSLVPLIFNKWEQYICINNVNSNPKTIQYGVHKGLLRATFYFYFS